MITKCKRLSTKSLIRLIAVLVIYVVTLRLHVFRQYHMTERFHHLVMDRLAADHVLNSTERPRPRVGKDIADAEAMASQENDANEPKTIVYEQTKTAYGEWQEEADAVYSDRASIVLNLDSEKWQGFNTTTLSDILNATNQSERAYMQCGNDVTMTTTRQPIRRLFHNGTVVIVGQLDGNISDYAVFGVGLESLDSVRAASYLFYGPLSGLAWGRIGYGTIVIIVDELHDWLTKALHRHVMKHFCSVRAVMIFLPAPKEKTVMISQISRIFSPFILRSFLLLEQAPPNYDPYIVTSDIDIWPIRNDMFKSETQSGEKASPDIFVLNHGCCAWFTHKAVRQKSYPLSYVRMSLSTWWKVLRANANIAEGDELTADIIIDVVRQEFGSVVDEPAMKGQNDFWFLDQHLLSYWINEYIKVNGRESVFFGSRTGMRLDRNQWPERVSSTTFEYTFDVHLPKLRAGWPKVLLLLQLMYGTNSNENKWSIRYRDKFISLLPPEILQIMEM